MLSIAEHTSAVLRGCVPYGGLFAAGRTAKPVDSENPSIRPNPIMTDADNTRGVGEAYVADVLFRRR